MKGAAPFILYFALSLLAALFSYWFVLAYCYGLSDKADAAPAILLLLMLAIYFVFMLVKLKDKVEKVFLLVAIPSLIFFSIFLLPDQVPDEIWHIYRVFDLRLSGAEMVVPLSLSRTEVEFPTDYPMMYSAITALPDWDKEAVITRDMTSYLAHLYLVPSVVVSACEALNFNPYVAVICARLSNATLFLVAGYCILRSIPIGKVMMFVYLLNPMLIQQEASCSADAVLNIVTLSYVAMLLWFKFSGSTARLPHYALFALLIVLSCLSKYAYAPFVVMSLLLLVPKISNRRVRRCVYFSSVTVALVGVALIVAFYQGDAYYASFELVRDPVEFASVMAKSFYEIGPLWIKEFGGHILGALNITVWEPCFWGYMLMLMLAAVFNLGETVSFESWEKAFAVLLSFVVTVMMILVFREWTLTVDLRSDVIMGVQGRYFIPYAILPLMCLITERSSLRRENCLILYSISLSAILLVDALFVLMKFC